MLAQWHVRGNGAPLNAAVLRQTMLTALLKTDLRSAVIRAEDPAYTAQNQLGAPQSDYKTATISAHLHGTP